MLRNTKDKRKTSMEVTKMQNNTSRENTPNGLNHLIKTLSEDLRFDGRKKDELRDIQIEVNVTATAEGSAIVTAGDCKVMAGVKLSLGTPYSDSPDEGVLMVGCELLPMAHPKIEQGPPSIDAIEIGRVIDRGIRESHSFDTKQLCVTPGEKVWIVSVDIVPLNHDGNIIDLGSLAALAALQATKFPVIKEDGTVDYHEKTDKGLDMQKLPIPVTVCKVGDHLIVDPTKIEEDLIEARLTITSLEDEYICSLQKGGNVPITVEEVEEMFNIAVEKGKELRALLN